MKKKTLHVVLDVLGTIIVFAGVYALCDCHMRATPTDAPARREHLS